MNILLWAPFGAGKHYWGPGTSAFRLYQLVKKYPQHNITLIHASDRQEEFHNIFIKQVKLPSLEKKGMKGLINYFIYFRAAKRWINEHYMEYDVVHGISAFEFTFRPLSQFARLGKPVFIKITGEFGGFGENSKTSRILGIARNREMNANSMTGYISISKAIENNLINFGVNKNIIHRIPNGVNIDKFTVLPNQTKIQLRKELKINNIFTFVYVGGLTFNKRIIETIKALSILKNEGYSCQYLIVGPDRSNGKVISIVKKMIGDLSLQNEIILIPQVEKPEIYFQISDVFVLVSKSEGLSNSLLEAMSCGLPCLVTNISGSQDLIVDRLDGLFTSGTSNDIAEKMKYFLNNQDELLSMSINVRKKIELEYSSEIVFDKHLKLFESSINITQ